jgi:hypothetical protein
MNFMIRACHAPLSSGTLAPRWGWRVSNRPPRALLWATTSRAFGAPSRRIAKMRDRLLAMSDFAPSFPSSGLGTHLGGMLRIPGGGVCGSAFRITGEPRDARALPGIHPRTPPPARRSLAPNRVPKQELRNEDNPPASRRSAAQASSSRISCNPREIAKNKLALMERCSGLRSCAPLALLREGSLKRITDSRR